VSAAGEAAAATAAAAATLQQQLDVCLLCCCHSSVSSTAVQTSTVRLLIGNVTAMADVGPFWHIARMHPICSSNKTAGKNVQSQQQLHLAYVAIQV
jgi:hypothetical protein